MDAKLTAYLFKHCKVEKPGQKDVKIKDEYGNLTTAKSKFSSAKHFDHLIAGSALKMSLEEKKVSPGLLVMIENITSDRASVYGFPSFPVHDLEQNLVLVPPRKVTTYNASSHTLAKQHAAAKSEAGGPEKKKVKREGGAKKGNSNFKVGIGKIQKAQIQAEDEHFVAEDDVDYSNINYNNSRNEDGIRYSDIGVAEQIMSSIEVVLPTNFLDIIRVVFQYFWELEFDDPLVNQAFFANIDNLNCAQYGLPAFADLPMSLSIIRDRINETIKNENGYSRSYKSPEDFYSDFRQMFENIFQFYPPDSTPRAKAIELNDTFHQKWAVAKSEFKYPID